MWKIISLSALLIVAQAADIQDFYGKWTEVAFYPASSFVPVCIHYTFAKSTENVQCTYADGTNASLVQASIIAETGGIIVDRQQSPMLPMRVVNTPAEVMPALNISLKCGDRDIRVSELAVIRLVNPDYFILYSNIPASREDTRTAVEQNSVKLFGRNVVSAKELHDVMMSIEDLKNRRGVQRCTNETHSAYKNTENVGGN